MFKKIFSFFAALTLCVGLWAETVSYLYPVYKTDGDPTSGIKEWKTGSADATEITNASGKVTWGTAGTTTWYVVKGANVQFTDSRAICKGDVRLVLADGAKLTISADNRPGIEVSNSSNSLTIYGQTNQSGQLIANADGDADYAGIGGNSSQSENITINGGIITARGVEAGAGIGSGDSFDGSNITINGGKVTAYGGKSAAGIGGGGAGDGSHITINGGTVSAYGKNHGAGIGGGTQGSGSYITINDGTVLACGGDEAAGIGGGYLRPGSNITINGGTVTVFNGVEADAIGSGKSATVASSNIYISDAYILNVGSNQYNNEVIAHSSATDMANDLKGKKYVQFGGLATPYTREVTAEQWGTVCLPYAATSFSGATFYKVNYYNAGENALYLEEVSALAAGMPYIFEATEDGTLTINHEATAPMVCGEEYNEGGLYGSLTRTTLAYDADHAYAAISGGSVVIVGEGNTVTVPACRAYLDMNEVATSVQPHKAPLRAMGVPRQQPTNNENVNADGNMNGKFVINGQFVIVKDGKMINALGF